MPLMLERILDRLFRKLEVHSGCDNADSSTPLYLKRWFLLDYSETKSRPAILLHKFVRSDPDNALHDHPWEFVSFMLWNGYVEQTEKGFERIKAGRVIHRTAHDKHRVHVDKPAWSLVITGPKEKSWSFFPETGGKVPWREFLAEKCRKVVNEAISATH